MGRTYTFTPTTDERGAALITFNLAAARARPLSRPGSVPDLGSIVVTTIFRIAAPPPAPRNLDVSLASDSFTVSWDAVAGTDRYRVSYRMDAESDWTELADGAPTDTSATWTPATLACGETYSFQVEARGDGGTYTAEWGTGATSAAETTGCDEQPAFTSSSYAFSIAETAASGTAVEQVAASPGDALAYTITDGNTASAFEIGAASGAISVAGTLDFATTPSYTLTVRVSDGQGGAGTATVVVTIVKPPPAPRNPSGTLADDSFTVGWDAVVGADRYQVSYRTDPESDWTALEDSTPTDTSATWTPATLVCGESYEFQVEAHGDGSAYSAHWGAAGTAAAVATTLCDQQPVFGSSSYTFSILEGAALGVSVGQVAASPSAGVSYAIMGGDTAGTFVIGPASGDITVAGTLDHATTPAYTLTVRATDGRGGIATATVDVTVVLPPPAPANLSASATYDAATQAWSVALSWDAPQNASVTGYQILRRRPTEGESGLLVYVENTESTAATFTDTNVAAGVPLVYRVKAIIEAGVGPQSNFVGITPE